MIVKINSGSSIFGALSYNQEKVEQGQAKVIFGQRIIQNVSDDGLLNMHYLMKSFEPYLQANRKTEKPVVHISLNPDPKDRLSDEQLAALAQAYMEKMGFGDQPYLVFKHEDIERHHLHIVSVRVDETGKKISDTYEYRRSMDTCRELEQAFGLHTVLEKEQKAVAENALKKVVYEQGDVKRQLTNVLRYVKDYRYQSLGEYNALLSLLNVQAEEVKGERNGKAFCGLVYSALNEKGEKVGNPFKSSLFAKEAGYGALQQYFQQSAEMVKEKGLKERTKSTVALVLSSVSNRSDFERELAKKGVGVVFRTNEQGRIYGATFIDHEQKAVFNGSRLGKEFSANVFQELFKADAQGQEQKTASTDLAIEWKPDFIQEKDKDSNEELSTGGAWGIFDLEPHGTDYQEEALIRKMKRKKKRKIN